MGSESVKPFPIFNSRALSDGNTYNLSDPAERVKYFHAKLGTKVGEVKDYLDRNTFVGFLLAKKVAGKGTFAKIFEEIVGSERVAHISVGDVVRKVHGEVEGAEGKKDLLDYLKGNYRGFSPVEEVFEDFVNYSQDKLIPTELILALVKREVERVGRRGLFIDGLPRSLDQISYSLYFRDLINFRDDPDFFVLFYTPESVIDARLKSRLICPICQTSKSYNLNPSKFVRYEKDAGGEGESGCDGKFYLVCDNSSCSGFGNQRLVRKKGDDLGIEAVRERVDLEQKLIDMARSLSGVPLVYLRNSIPVSKASENVEDYEITPEFSYELNESGEVKVIEKPWVVKDDAGVDSYSLLPATTALAVFDQIHGLLVG